MNDIINQANALGFRGIYLLKPAPYPFFLKRRAEGSLHKNSDHLSADPTKDYPWANAVLLLLYPYKPYVKEYRVSGYYPASNRSYHAVSTLIRYFSERSIRAERAALPIRETLLRHGIGIACKNGLTAVMPFGTRFVAQMLALDIPKELMEYRIDTMSDQYKTCPESCNLCQKICPTQAISDKGMDFSKCIRADMEDGPMQQLTMERMPALLGCELCQYACPLNSKIETEMEFPTAFALEQLLAGNTKAAYDLIGKNMRSGKRLEQHALIMAANLGRTDLLPMVESHIVDSRIGIAQAAEYAISVLHKRTE